MPIKDIKKVCYVGAGTMGSYNSLISALAGYEVTLYDISEDALENAPQNQLNWVEILAEREIAQPDAVQAASARITRTSDPQKAAQGADLLSESVFERLDLKRETHRKFEQLLPSHAIMTTNTSTLLLSDIESAVAQGEKFAAMHFHQFTPLVDIVAGPRTTSDTIEIIKRFIKSQDQVYVELKKEREGYLHNDMFVALLSTAIMLAVLLKMITIFRGSSSQRGCQGTGAALAVGACPQDGIGKTDRARFCPGDMLTKVREVADQVGCARSRGDHVHAGESLQNALLVFSKRRTDAQRLPVFDIHPRRIECS